MTGPLTTTVVWCNGTLIATPALCVCVCLCVFVCVCVSVWSANSGVDSGVDGDYDGYGENVNPAEMLGSLVASSEKQPFTVVKRADGERVYVCDVCGYETRFVILHLFQDYIYSFWAV